MFLGFVLSLVPHAIWASPDICWTSDTPHAANARFAGGDHAPGVFHISESTGDGFEDGASLHNVSCRAEVEKLGSKGHFSGMDTSALQVSDVIVDGNSHTCGLSNREITPAVGMMSDEISVELGCQCPANLAGIVKNPGSPAIKRK